MIQLFLFAWLAGQAATSDGMQHVQARLEARQQHNVEQEIAEFRKATEIDPSLADAFCEPRRWLLGETRLRRAHRSAQACTGT
jgi:hypothetical protein